MARTVSEIKQSIIAKKVEYEQLNGLTSPSASALFKILAEVFAWAAWVHEQIVDHAIQALTKKMEERAFHNLAWYQAEALNYQHGDELMWDDNKKEFRYAVIDTDKRIVARSAAIESGRTAIVKAVKEVGGQLQPLSTSENAGLNAFLNKRKDTGVKIFSRSWLPDDLYLEYEFIYDALVLSSNGSLLSDANTFPANDAIENYIEQLDFNGRFRISKLEDAVQNAQGIVDFKRISLKSRHGSNEFVEIDVSIIAQSGYMRLHENSVLTYKASNV